MAHPNIDPASLQLMLMLELDDANALRAAARNGNGIGVSADSHFAVNLYLRELESLLPDEEHTGIFAPTARTASSTVQPQPVPATQTIANPTPITHRRGPPALTRPSVTRSRPSQSLTADLATATGGHTTAQPRSFLGSRTATAQAVTSSIKRPAGTPVGDFDGVPSRKRQRASTPTHQNRETRTSRPRSFVNDLFYEPDSGSDSVLNSLLYSDSDSDWSLGWDPESTPKRPRLINSESNGEELHGFSNENTSSPARDRTTGTAHTHNVPADTTEHGANAVSKGPKKIIVCTACTEEVPTRYAAIGACGHRYCRSCTQRLFNDAIRNDNSFPPKCCQVDIPIKSARKLLSKSVIAKFAEKEVEHATTDKTYCSACRAFIDPAVISGNLAKCPTCKRQTCTKCKNKRHISRNCLQDQGAKQLQDLAAKRRWQACPQCKFMVEKASGCNHITCRCGHQFCYLCAATWETYHSCNPMA